MAEQGQQRGAARQGCLKCHTVDGAPHIGPTWLDLYDARRASCQDGQTIRVDEAYLTESMMDPGREDRGRATSR